MDKIIKCSVYECNSSAYWKDNGKKGFCGKHYRRFQRYGDASVCKYAEKGTGCIYKGYKIIRINGKSIYEHRHIMEQHIGRKLNPNEIIHHINENGLDNRIENLMIDNQSNHASHHGKKRYAHLKNPCEQCGKQYTKKTYQPKRNEHFFCSRACASTARKIGGISHIKSYSKQQ